VALVITQNLDLFILIQAQLEAGNTIEMWRLRF